jgi:hypothetical protein
MGSAPFIKLLKDTKLLTEIIKRRPTAYVLLTLIALRARRTNEPNLDDLEVGEAFIGDYKSYGATEQIYRSDKVWLKTNGLATFRSTNRGTIARIANAVIFDINASELTGYQRTNEQATNEQLTTNKKDKNDKNDKKILYARARKNSTGLISSSDKPETTARRPRASKYPTPESLGVQDFGALTTKYRLKDGEAQATLVKLVRWEKRTTGRHVYDDYFAALDEWIDRDIKSGRLKQRKGYWEEAADELEADDPTAAAGLRAILLGGNDRAVATKGGAR